MPRILDLLAVALGAVALALALPSEILPQGFGALGWLVLVPVFRLTRLYGWLACSLAGAVFALVFYSLSCFWLAGFHPLAFPIVLMVMLPQYAAVFALLRWIWLTFPKRGFWAQAALWTVFEWARNLDWLAFPYGGLASTQSFFPLAFQSADVFGASAITFLMALVAAVVSTLPRQLPVIDVSIGLLLLAGNFGYGAWKLSAPETGTPWKVALVQNAQDPWRGGVKAYAPALETLIDLSRKALDQKPDAVVWPETAFVPGIEWHTLHRPDPSSWQLVRRLEDFLQTSSVPVLLGNDHGVLAADGKTRLDYNAALVWNNGWKGRYFKNRLVPFTESFPWKDSLPGLKRFLEDNGSHFWESGTGFPTLDVGGVTVGTPICYEDAFPEAARAFSLGGARALVNLTNDSWSPGTAARNQHWALAVFRSVETRMPLLRAGNDGKTVLISSRGEAVASLPVGSRDVLVGTVYLGDGKLTVYTITGDVLPPILFILLVFSMGRVRLFFPSKRSKKSELG